MFSRSAAMRKSVKSNLSPKLPKSDHQSNVLDFGAGLGRHLLAFRRAGIPYNRLVAWETNRSAERWLHRLADVDPKLLITGTGTVESGLNYVDGFSSTRRLGKFHGSNLQSLYQCAENMKFNCIWSSSVFTHMWPSTARATLNCFRTISADVESTQINTWLIVDEKTKIALANGTADRKLPLEVNGIFTYSWNNPLVCTAFRYSDVYSLYQQAGLKIVDILWGSWRGGLSNGIHDQDIVISRSL